MEIAELLTMEVTILQSCPESRLHTPRGRDWLAKLWLSWIRSRFSSKKRPRRQKRRERRKRRSQLIQKTRWQKIKQRTNVLYVVKYFQGRPSKPHSKGTSTTNILAKSSKKHLVSVFQMLEEKRSSDEKHWSEIRMCAVRQHQENVVERTFPCGFKMARGSWRGSKKDQKTVFFSTTSEDYFFSAAEHALAAKFEFWELHRHTAQSSKSGNVCITAL